MCQNTIIRCQRCGVILTEDDLTAKHMYPEHWAERPRCISCSGDITDLSMYDYMHFTAVKTPTREAAEHEWVRRIRMADYAR